MTNIDIKPLQGNIPTRQMPEKRSYQNFILTISSSVGGSTDPAPGSYQYPAPEQVTVTAIPYEGYELEYWLVDGIQILYPNTPGNVAWGNTITPSMYADRQIQAIFRPLQVSKGKTVIVTDQFGNPIQGAAITVNDGDYGTIANGKTDSNGQWVIPSLPFPATSGNDYYTILADYYTATNQASANWYGEESLTLQLNIYVPSNYDITVIAGQGGTTNPAPGHLTGQGVITVTAIPYIGNIFDHWDMNNVFLTNNPSFHTGSTGTFEAFFKSVAPPSGALGKITAIRIKDIARGVWFNWDNGAWDSNGEPQVTPGADNLYIAFAVKNIGNADGTLTLKITDADASFTATKSVSIPAGGTDGIEWTGNMYTYPYGISLSVTP